MFGDCSLPSLCQIASTIVIFYILKFAVSFYLANKKKSPPKLHKSDWKQDVVYLYQFERSKCVPNVSPYCLKLETYLRVHNIKHEVIGTTMLRSSKGLLPFVEINGEQFADSQLIVMELDKRFNISSKEKLTNEQKAISRVVDRLVEGSLFYINFLFKTKDRALDFADVIVNGSPLKFVLAPILYFSAKSRLAGEGTGKHTTDEVTKLLTADLTALNDLLGDKDYFLGSFPSLVDCTVFGHLASIYYLPYETATKTQMNRDFPKLKNLVQRMASTYFKDHAIGKA